MRQKSLLNRNAQNNSAFLTEKNENGSAGIRSQPGLNPKQDRNEGYTQQP